MSRKIKKFIGVFDSGFGGLNILQGIVKELSQYNYLYLGDSARMPYGHRPKELIYNFTRQAVDFLFSRDCELIVIACNTASSEALQKIQQEYLPKYYPARRVLGVLIPAAEYAVAKTKNKKVGVLATEGTVRSGAFVREADKLDRRIKIFQQACPRLVPLVEAGEQNSPAATVILKKYLAPLLKQDIDVLVLGCTHYGLLVNQIRKLVGRNIFVLAEAPVVARKLKHYLGRHPKMEEKIGRGEPIKFYSTDLTDRFETLGSKFFGRNIKVERVSLGP